MGRGAGLTNFAAELFSLRNRPGRRRSSERLPGNSISRWIRPARREGGTQNTERSHAQPNPELPAE